MWVSIWEFVLKYWIEFLFTGVISIGSYIIKKYNVTKVKEQEEGRKAFLIEVKKEIENESNRSIMVEEKLQADIDKVNNRITDLTKGVLSMQRREFYENCEKLLDDRHIITLEEYQDISSDHEAYNGMGGNHRGDILFSLVKKKAESTLTL